ncbi:type VI secretion system Vgr family protein [Novipirellula artificiosorum]|uniref:Phage-related baseplate assembly protein n=1 Tax=Novipirellula artificiosorum TaxID=2528016 RepID=A0A5C6DVG5_9BACT|nr:type VI secretion system tip protein VgrG [Novipirellula artificiosorum]TWU40592.1 Phage-related baseplate assembly protein [Novipirellula artificiosorum]
MAMKQANRRLHLDTVLGEDVLLLTEFSGSEEMSRLFRYELELISDDPGIKPQDIVGTPIGWSAERGDNSRRHWHGFVSGLARGDVDDQKRRNYRVEVVPWLWFLTQTSDCKIFQEMNLPAIIDEVLGEFSFADFNTNFQLDHKDWEYCVQYRETDFNFLSRLMEQEGMCYYFKHSEGAHQMVITDHKNGYYALPESKVDFPRETSAMAITDHLTSWQRQYQFHSGKYAQRDYNFTTPSNDLATDTGTIVDLPKITDFELYDYPGEYPDKGVGGGETKLRMEAEETRHEIVNGSSQCRTFQVGGTFAVGQHRDSSEQGQEVMITSIHHAGSEPMGYETGRGDKGFDYRNGFACIPSSRVYRPARSTPKPIISGIQTAVVTGPSGEEIYPDEFGRVKCQFHWDRYGEKDDKSSCWIRVSQVHAGASFGGIDIPRMGEEVVVSFLEGDPDRPLITGRVYHADNMPPWELPANKTQSGYLSRSSQDGGKDNANALRFEDKKGEEQVWLHAEKNQDIEVENDETHWVGRDRSKTIDRDEDSTIKRDRTEKVGRHERIAVGKNRTEEVGSNENVTIGNNRTVSVAKDESLGVGKDQSLEVAENQTITVGDNQELTIAKNQTIQIGANREVTVQDENNVTVGKTMLLDVANELEIRVGKSSLIMKKNGTIMLKGKDITLQGSGKINIKSAGNMTLKGSKIAQN